MNNHGIARPKIRDIGAYVGLHSQSDSIESLSIVDGLCVVCQQFRHITSTPNISRSHHSSFGDLHQAASLGCALCQFILDQPQSYGYVENYTDEGTKWVPVAESLVDLYGFSHMLVRLEFAVEPSQYLYCVLCIPALIDCRRPSRPGRNHTCTIISCTNKSGALRFIW
jgi:hypothetical protein